MTHDTNDSTHGKKSLAGALAGAAVLGTVAPVPAHASQPPRPQLPDVTGLLRDKGHDYSEHVQPRDKKHEFPSPATVNKLKQHLPGDTVDDILALYDTGDEGYLPSGQRVAMGTQLSQQLAHLTHLVQHLIYLLEESPTVASDQAVISTLEHNVTHFLHDSDTETTTVRTAHDDDSDIIVSPDQSANSINGATSDHSDNVSDQDESSPSDDTRVVNDDVNDDVIDDDDDTDEQLKSIIADETATMTTTAEVELDSQIAQDLIATAIEMTPNSIILSTARNLGAQTGDPRVEQALMTGAYTIVKNKPHAVQLVRSLPSLHITTTTESLTRSIVSIGRALVNNGTTPVTTPDIVINVQRHDGTHAIQHEVQQPHAPQHPQQHPDSSSVHQDNHQSRSRILPDLITPVGTNDRINLAISRAQSKLGTPYAWGGGKAGMGLNGKPEYYPSEAVDGSGAVGYDCSGLVVHAFYQVLRNDRTVSRTGDPEQDYIRMPRWSGDQYMSGGQHVPLDSAKPGDLLFWGVNGSQHVAIYLGNGRMIEAKDSDSGIIESPVRYSGIMPFAVRVIL